MSESMVSNSSDLLSEGSEEYGENNQQEYFQRYLDEVAGSEPASDEDESERIDDTDDETDDNSSYGNDDHNEVEDEDGDDDGDGDDNRFGTGSEDNDIGLSYTSDSHLSPLDPVHSTTDTGRVVGEMDFMMSEGVETSQSGGLDFQSSSEYDLKHVTSSMSTEVVGNLRGAYSRDNTDGIDLDYIDEEEVEEPGVSEIELPEIHDGNKETIGSEINTPRRNQRLLHAESPASTLSQGTSLPSPPSTMKRVKMSPRFKSTPSKRGLPLTPPRRPLASSSSKRPKIISPFSPRARRYRIQPIPGHTASTMALNWSMAPSRKVSILVNVAPHLDATISFNEEKTLCLYPNVAAEDPMTNISIPNSPARSIQSNYSTMSQTSILNKAGPGQELILVNPKAFGDQIPTSVTVETARFVAQFSNKASEDWVRKFRFDEVCWPDVKQLVGIKKQNTNATMEDIGRATVSDVKAGRNVVVFGHGVHRSGKVESMFGTVATEGFHHFNTIKVRENPGLELGLLGLIVSNLKESEKAENKNMRFTISFIEIVQEDVLKDLLLTNQRGRSENKTLKIRHPDTVGAIVQNVTEIEVDSVSSLKEYVKKAFHSKTVLKSRRMAGGRGHIIVTIKVFADSQSKSGNKYSILQLVDMACAETEQMNQSPVGGHSKVHARRIQDRRSACIRKSLSGLGAILRGLIVHDAQKISHSITYRDCTLTKLLQRALDNESSRAVIISTVCPRRDSYARTLHSLNFLNRLLVRPTQTAESPFETIKGNGLNDGSINADFFSPSSDYSIGNSVAHSVSTMASEAIKSEFVQAKANGAFLKSLVTDPRQRLATLLSPKESPSGNASLPGVPMKEITTIQEIENDGKEEVFETVLKDLDALGDYKEPSHPNSSETVYNSPYVDDISDAKIEMNETKDSGLTDEQNFERNDDDFDASVLTDPDQECSQDEGVTFDEVLEQLDELDQVSSPAEKGQENQSYRNLFSHSEESLEPLESTGVEDVGANTIIVDRDGSHHHDARTRGTHVERSSHRPDPDGMTTDEIESQDQILSRSRYSRHFSSRTDQDNSVDDEFSASMNSTLTPSNVGHSNNDRSVISNEHSIDSYTGQMDNSYSNDGDNDEKRDGEFSVSMNSTLTPSNVGRSNDDRSVISNEHSTDSYTGQMDNSYSSDGDNDEKRDGGYDSDISFPREHSSLNIGQNSDESFPLNEEKRNSKLDGRGLRNSEHTSPTRFQRCKDPDGLYEPDFYKQTKSQVHSGQGLSTDEYHPMDANFTMNGNPHSERNNMHSSELDPSVTVGITSGQPLQAQPISSVAPGSGRSSFEQSTAKNSQAREAVSSSEIDHDDRLHQTSASSKSPIVGDDSGFQPKLHQSSSGRHDSRNMLDSEFHYMMSTPSQPVFRTNQHDNHQWSGDVGDGTLQGPSTNGQISTEKKTYQNDAHQWAGGVGDGAPQGPSTKVQISAEKKAYQTEEKTSIARYHSSEDSRNEFSDPQSIHAEQTSDLLESNLPPTRNGVDVPDLDDAMEKDIANQSIREVPGRSSEFDSPSRNSNGSTSEQSYDQTSLDHGFREEAFPEAQYLKTITKEAQDHIPGNNKSNASSSKIDSPPPSEAGNVQIDQPSEKISIKQSPQRQGKKALLMKAQNLVNQSNALRGYASPGKNGVASARESLENYKALLKESLDALDGEMGLSFDDELTESEANLRSPPIALESNDQNEYGDFAYPASDESLSLEETYSPDVNSSKHSKISKRSGSYHSDTEEKVISNSAQMNEEGDSEVGLEHGVNLFRVEEGEQKDTRSKVSGSLINQAMAKGENNRRLESPTSGGIISLSKSPDLSVNTSPYITDGRTSVPEAMISEIERLEDLVQHVADSTNESELISELANDQLRIMKSFVSNGQDGELNVSDPLVQRIKYLSLKTEALQTVVDGTMKQLNDAQDSYKKGEIEMMELQSRMEETMEEIQSLKDSNKESIEQIRQDHLDAITAARNKGSVEFEQRLGSMTEAMVEKEKQLNLLQAQLDKASETRQKAEEMNAVEVASLVNALDEKDQYITNITSDLRDAVDIQKKMKEKAEERLALSRNELSDLSDRLHQEQDAMKTLREENSSLLEQAAARGVDEENMTAQLSLENSKLRAELEGRDETIKMQMERLSQQKKHYDDLLKAESVEKGSLEDEIGDLQKRLLEEARDKDATESKLTDIRLSVRSKEDAITDLTISMNDMEETHLKRVKMLSDEKETLKDQVGKLEERLLEETRDKSASESDHLRELLGLRTELREKTDINNQLVDTLSSLTEKNKELSERSAQVESEWQERKVAYEIDKSSLQKKLSDCNVEKADLLEQVSDLLKDNSALKGDKRRDREASESTLLDLRKCSDDKEKLKEQLSKLIKEKSDLMNKVTTNESEISFLETTLKKCNEQKDDLTEQLSALEREVSALKNENVRSKSSHEEALKDCNMKKARLEEEASTLTKENLELKDERISSESKISRMEASLKKIETEKEDLIEEISTLNREHSDLKDAIMANESEEKIMEATLKDFSTERDRLKEKISSLETENSQLNAGRSALESSLEATLKDVHVEKRKFAEELSNLERENSVLRDEVASKDSSISSLETKLDDHDVQKNKLEQDVSSLEKENHNLNHQMATIEASLRESIAKKDKLMEELSSLSTDNFDLKEQVTAVESQKSSLETKLTTLIAEKEKSDNEISSFTTQSNNLKAKMAARESSLEATLKEYSREKEKLSEEVSDLLKRNSDLMDEMAVVRSEVMSMRETSKECSAEKEKFVEEVSNLSKDNSILKDELTISKSTALSLGKTLNEYNIEKEKLGEQLSNLVTENSSLNEEIIRVKAAYESETSSLQSNLRDIESEKESLKTEVSNLTTKISSLQEKSTTDASMVSSLEQQLKACNTDKEVLVEEVSNLTRENSDLKVNVTSNESKLTSLEIALKDHAIEEEKLTEELSSLDRQNAALVGKTAAYESKILLLEATLKGCNAEKEELVQQVSYATKKNSDLMETIDAYQKSSDESMKDYNTEKERLVGEISKLATENSNLKNEISTLQTRYETKISSLETELKDSHSEKETLIEELAGIHSVNSDFENELNTLKTKLLLMEEEKKASGEELSNLSEVNAELDTEKSDLTKSLSLLEKENSSLSQELSSCNENIIALQEELLSAISSKETAEKMLLDEKSAIELMSKENNEAGLIHTKELNDMKKGFDEINKQLVEEKSKRLHDKASSETELSKIVEKAEKEQRRINDELVKSNEAYDEIEKDLETERERGKEMRDKHVSVILSLKASLQDETKISEDLQNQLSQYENQLSSLRGDLEDAKLSNSKLEQESAIREEALTNEINNHTKDLDAKDEEISQLGVEIQRLNKSLEEEIGSKVNSNNEQLKRISEMEEAMRRNNEERTDLFSQLSSISLQAEMSTKQLAAETEEKTKAASEAATWKDTASKLEVEKHALNKKLESLLEEMGDMRERLQDQISDITKTKSSDVVKLMNSLESKSVKNKKLKELLTSARVENEEMKEESNAMIQRLDSEREQMVEEWSRKNDELSSRLNDFCIINESLQSESASLRIKLSEEKEEREKLLKKNKVLKSTMTENEEQMRNQMKDLEATMQTTLTKIEQKRSKKTEDEKMGSKRMIDELTKENDSFRLTITRLEATVNELQYQKQERSHGNDGGAGTVFPSPEEYESIKHENTQLRNRIRAIEENRSVLSGRSVNIDDTEGGDRDGYKRSYSVHLRVERDRRIKAEEFAAAMAARAKAGFEERNEQIVNLRLKVSNLELEKENLKRISSKALSANTAVVPGGGDYLALALDERDEALEEARRFRLIAQKLNEQVTALTDGESDMEHQDAIEFGL